MKKGVSTVLSLALVAVFAGCDKAPEKMAEKAIQSALEKEGGKAKVDLSGGGAKITTTDASGNTSRVEIGAATVTESDVGVPFYPGTKPLQGQASKISSGEGSAVTVALQTDDSPAKVAAFYRDQFKARAKGAQLVDMSGGDGETTLMLNDEKSKSTIQVHVSKADKGTSIQIMANRAGK